MPDKLPVLDTPPSNGVWVEHMDLEITEEEIDLGNAMGDATRPPEAEDDV